jgi:hypothetical protein
VLRNDARENAAANAKMDAEGDLAPSAINYKTLVIADES